MGDGYGEFIYEVAVDPSGNVLIAGEFDSPITLGGATLVPSGVSDGFVAKFTPSGQLIWQRGFGGVGAETSFGRSITTDNVGNVIVTGAFGHGTVDFGGGAVLTYTGYTYNGVILKLNSDGSTLWAKQVAPYQLNIARDSANNLLVEGSFSGSVNLGGGVLTCTPTLGGPARDFFVAKFDPSGNHLWSKRYGGSGDEQHSRIVASPSGEFIVFGSTYPYNGGEIDFGTGVLPPAGGWDILIAKFDSDGNCQWSARYGDAANQHFRAVALDAAGNIAISGSSNSTLQLGGMSVSSGVFLAKLTPAGQTLWAKSWPSSSMEVAFDSHNNLVTVGTIYGGDPVDFGGGTFTAEVEGDVFVARFDSEGNHLASQYFTGPNMQYASGMCLDNADNVVLSGILMGTVDFGGGPLTVTGYYPDDYFDQDAFIVKFSTQSPLPVLISSFNASAKRGSIEIRWDVASDEPVEESVLYRREDGAYMGTPIVSMSDPNVRAYTDTNVKPGKTYIYQLLIHTVAGNDVQSTAAIVTLPKLVTELKQNYPNPFNPRTTIEYVLSERASIAIGIFDAAGKVVAEFPQGLRGPGTYRQEWNGLNAAGQPVASGVYFYRLLGAGPASAQRKMILLK